MAAPRPSKRRSNGITTTTTDSRPDLAMNRRARLSKNLTDIFGSDGADECRVCTNPLGGRHPQRKYCSDRCQRIAYAVIKCYRWELVRDYVLARDDHACVNPDCDNDAATDGVTLHIDHVTPLTDAGAAHDPSNLQTLCDACNLAKGDTTHDYRPDADAGRGRNAETDGGLVATGSLEDDLQSYLTRERDPDAAPPYQFPEPTEPSTATESTPSTTAMSERDRQQTNDRDVTLADHIDIRDPDQLTPYGNNPKTHPEKQVEKIAESIREFGWDQPIVVDGNDEVIKGHGRLEAAKRLSLSHVPVIERTDLGDAEKRAARIADNRTSDSMWDDAKLAAELDALDTPSIDIELDTTGFDPDELDDILDPETTPVDETLDGDDPTDDGSGEDGEPETFDSIEDDVTTEHECPNCGYEW